MDMAGSETADRTDAIVAEDSGTKHVESPSSTRNPEPFSFQRRQTKRSNRRQIKLGPYLLLQTLGEGEFGKVKLGIHTETGQEFAVKLIRKESVGYSASRLSKVEREINALRALKHPNIVKLFDVIESEKYIGIILEYASGGELFEHILAHRSLKEKDAKRLFAQLVSSVHYMHQKRIVHRDLKLENLLLDRNRNIIVTDFGFANQFDSQQDDFMATSCGSPCYAAPELVMNEGLYAGTAVDVWSCGVILYAMLCGYLPFDDDPHNPDGNNINLLYRYIASHPPNFPAHLSQDAQDIIRRMLVADPAERWTIERIQQHPWLTEYRSLFDKKNDELEIDAAAVAEQASIPSYRKSIWSTLKTPNPSNDQKGVIDRSLTSTDSRPPVVRWDADVGDKRSRPATVHGATTLRRLTINRAGGAATLTESPNRSRTKTAQEASATLDKPAVNALAGRGSPPSPSPRRGPRRERLFSLFTGPKSQDCDVRKRHVSLVQQPIDSSSGAAQTWRPAESGTDVQMLETPPTPASRLRNVFMTSLRVRRKEPSTKAASTIREYLAKGGSQSATVTTSCKQGLESDIMQERKAMEEPRMSIEVHREESLKALTRGQWDKDGDRKERQRMSMGIQGGRHLAAIVRNGTTRGSKRSKAKETSAAFNTVGRNAMDSPVLMESSSEQPTKNNKDKSIGGGAGRKMMAWIKRKSQGKDRSQSPDTSPCSSSPVIPDSYASAANMSQTRMAEMTKEEKESSVGSKLRIHNGAVDRAALTSRPPSQVMADVTHTLRALGIDVKSDGEFKVKCTRRRAKVPEKTATASVNAAASTDNNVAAVARSPSILTLFPNPGQLSAASSKQALDTHTPPTSQSLLTISTNTTSHDNTRSDDDGCSNYESAATEPIYGDPTIDAGDEIRFMVEICRFRNLPGIHIVDIRRLRGSVWTYKFIYHKLLDLLNLGKAGHYLEQQHQEQKSGQPTKDNGKRIDPLVQQSPFFVQSPIIVDHETSTPLRDSAVCGMDK